MTWSGSTGRDPTFYSPAVLRVALDLAHARQSAAGTARVARSLARAPRRCATTWSCVPIGDGALLARDDPRRRALALYQDLAWYPVLGRRAARRARADVHHLSLARGPLWRGRPPVSVTVHDLVPQQLPETMSGWNRRYSRATHDRLLRSADLVVTSSQMVAAQLTARRIAVVPLGVADELRGPGARRAARGRGLRAVRRHARAAQEPDPAGRRRRAVRGLRLVVAGAGGWGDGRPSTGVEWLGRVDDATLHALYAGAACRRSRRWTRASGCRRSRRWPSAAPSWPPAPGRCPRSAATRPCWSIRSTPTRSRPGCSRRLARADELRELGRARAALYTWERSAELLVSAWQSLT